MKQRTLIVDQWQRNAIDVFCTTTFREGINEGTITRYREFGQFEEVSIADEPNEAFSDRPAPTFRIPMPVLDEIVAWYQKEYPTRQNDDQIKDLRATRDRLLTLVEMTALEGTSPEGVAVLKELRS